MAKRHLRDSHETYVGMENRALAEHTSLSLSSSSSSSKPRIRQYRPSLGVIENNSVRQRLPTARTSSKAQVQAQAQSQSQSTTTAPHPRQQQASRQHTAATAKSSIRPGLSAKNRRTSTVGLTDPHHTRALWDEVMSATRATKASEGKKVRGGGRGRGTGVGVGVGIGAEAGARAGTLRASAVTAAASSTAASETGSQSQSQTTRNVSAKPSNTDFYELVLLPRGIVIDGRTPSMLAYKHFSTTIPKDEHRAYYQEASGGYASKVWLEKDEAFVQDVVAEYDWMTTHNSCEAEFALYGKESLIRREPHRPRDQRLWIPHRMVELVTKPKTVDNVRAPPRNPTPWWSPPLLDPSQPYKEYSFDIRPDCQYWLSLNFANREYKRLYKDFVYENSGDSVCPYFTVEFKKDKGSDDTATNQLATAAALALHNRCILKHQYFQATKQSWSDTDVEQQLRHYGLTFAGREYQFWRIKPDVSQQDLNTNWIWRGCKMENVSRGSLQGEVEMGDFIDWVNEIHRWGLTVYGKACEADVKGCIDYGPSGIRTSSAVAMISEQLEDTQIE